MSKQDSQSFRQLPPPQLQKIFTISQPQNELIFEHWKHLITALEWEIDKNSRIMCLMYKSKASISLICFQDSCLLYQRKFKIAYAQVQEITCLKIHPIMIKFQNTKKREIITAVGFYDGSIELYHLSITSKSIVFKKLLNLEHNSKSAVTSVVMSRGHLFVCRLHQVQVYKSCLSIIANVIVNESIKCESLQRQFKCNSISLPLKGICQGLSLSMSSGKNAIHIFNQSQGSKSFLLDSLQEYGTILDSITFIKETLEENIVIGDTNDKLKIIYKNRKIVQRYHGFKNYCSDAFHRVGQKAEELWVADYHGNITYLERQPQTQLKSTTTQNIKMVDVQIHFSTKICEYGIKKFIICNKLMAVLDSESNIHLFDIVRKESDSEISEIDIESLEEYCSDA